MTNAILNTIKDIKVNLRKIKATGKARINLTQYLKHGLVKVRHKKVRLSNGYTESIFSHLILTEKAKQFLNLL